MAANPALSTADIKRLCRYDPAFYAATKLRGPDSAPYYGKFLVSAHHERWSEIVRRHRWMCIQAARGHGKSPVAGTLIMRTDGRRVPVEDWEGGEVWAYNPETRKFEVDYAPASNELPPEPCFKITTRTGRTVSVNGEHKFLTSHGWVRADELATGESIAAPQWLPHPRDTRPVEDSWLIGLAVGDGTMTGSSVMISSGDDQVVAHLDAVAAARGWRLVGDGRCTYRLSARQGLRAGTAKHWAREVGIDGHVARSKRVPPCIFASDPASVADFLAGYLDADGCVNRHGGGSIEYYSVSADLLRDVQHLLLRFGVVSTLAVKRGTYRGEEHLSWRLTIRGTYLIRLAETLNGRVRGARGGQLQTLAEERRGRTRAVPAGEVVWDEVVDVEALGDLPVFGITVERLENYVANDLVNHNTFFFNLAYPIWQAERNPGYSQNNYGVIFSGSEPQAQRILTDIKTEVEQNPALAHLLPPQRSKNWGVKMIQFANGHRIYARGWASKARGLHPKYVVLDDVLNDEDMTSQLIRQKNIDYFLSAVKPMLDDPNSQLIVVGTPFHIEDLYGYLGQSKDIHSETFPAMDAVGVPLWPEKFDIPTLEKEERLMGRVRFAREYMCNPVNDGASLFPMELFTNKFAVAKTRIGRPMAEWRALGISTVFMGCDFAISRNVGADYTALFVVGVDASGTRWIMDIIRAHGMPFNKQLELIHETARKYEVDVVAIETNQMQRIFEDELVRTTDLPIHGVQTGAEKHSLERGIPYIATLLENGKYRIPRGDEASREATDVWIREMHSFTFDKGKVVSVGGHDDAAMACFVAEKGIKTGMFSFAFGEQEGDTEAYQAIMQGMALPGLKQVTADMLDELRSGGGFETGDPELDKDLDAFTLSSNGTQGSRVTRSVLVPGDQVTQADRETSKSPGDGLRPTREVLVRDSEFSIASLLGTLLGRG